MYRMMLVNQFNLDELQLFSKCAKKYYKCAQDKLKILDEVLWKPIHEKYFPNEFNQLNNLKQFNYEALFYGQRHILIKEFIERFNFLHKDFIIERPYDDYDPTPLIQNIKDPNNFLITEVQFALILIFISNGHHFKYLSQKLRNNKKIALCAIKEDHNLFKWLDDSLQNDEDIILATLSAHGNKMPRILYYTNSSARNNEKIIKKCLETLNYENVLPYIGDELRNNRDFILEILQKNYSTFGPSFSSLPQDLNQAQLLVFLNF